LEERAVDPLLREEPLVRFESLRRARLSDDDALAYQRQVGQVLFKRRRAIVGSLIEAFHDVTRLLKLYREEEGRARVYALRLAAHSVRAARLDVVYPEP